MLKDSELRNAKPRDKRYALYDGEGLYAEVHPSGAITFRYRYRLEGRREKVTIGRYGPLSLKDARQIHKQRMADVAKGTSPSATVRERKRRSKSRIYPEMPVRDFAERYIEDVVRPSRKDSRTVEAYVRGRIVDRIGDIPLNKVSTDDAWRIIDQIKARGRLQSANVVRALLKRMFQYAISRGTISTNPVAAIRAKEVAPIVTRDRNLTKDELGRFLRALYQSSASRPYKLALHLIALTMVRKGELTNARWAEFDLKAKTWTIPGAKTKTGADHVVFLSTQAVEILEELRVIAGTSEWVLPSRNTIRKPIGSNTLNSLLRELEVGIDHFTIHDMRRTASTLLHDAGFSSDVIEKALGHKMGGVRGVYNRAEYKAQRTEMLQTWANLVDDAISDNKVVVGRFKSTA